MKKTELLSPAKDKETAIAAINCGADAVYIGASAFGARKNALNSIDDIQDVVNYAHKFWVKVFVTVNTILTDNELEEAVELVKILDKIGVDAVIVQDLGLLQKMNEENVKLPIHMSTQCDNRDFEKIKFFNDIGVKRVVLPRELSLSKIKEMHNQNPELELESFVHGALCVSYSGQCYLSQYIGGRSANRGECAQPCRKKYTVETDNGKVLAKDIHALCLKDFNASRHLKTMVSNGVYSFKIEGRLKETSYVKNITAYYRQELDKISQKTSSGKCTFLSLYSPEKSFNRGFTDYFLEGRKDCYNFESPKSSGEYIGKIIENKNGCFKINTSKRISAQDGLTDGKNGCLVNKVVNGYIYPNKKIKFDIGTKIYRNLDVIFENEINSKNWAKRQIGVKVKVNAGVNTRSLVLKDEDDVLVELTLPVGESAKNPEKMEEVFIKQFSKTGESDFYIAHIEIDGILPFLPVSEINKLRRDAFELLMQQRLKCYKRERQKDLKYIPYYKREVDYRANVHNRTAKEFYSQCGCNVKEFSLESHFEKNKIYELMRTKHCIKYALNMCKAPQNLVLKDEKGCLYPLKFDCKNCEMVVCAPDYENL